ncbi:hypothetical protein SGRA_1408 [Saprospira grandis str. Lewin]|uniref:Uncharacterized protein n=1 Tax=Saprospira grandis (strain Lewin) TaxID=984262 RepID=H6L7S2_SAPGL|nr:hypothetical protein SGRA_1408 [Saprospira grandis str. Lewin]
MAEGQTELLSKAKKRRAEQACEPRSIAAASKAGRGPQKKIKKSYAPK